MSEDDRAFPYTAPTEAIKERYKEIFALKEPLKDRPCKIIFDKVVSLLLIVLFSPLVICLCVAHKIEGLMDPDAKGPFVYGYTSVSREKRFKKYKLRVTKGTLLPADKWKSADYRDYPNERDPENITKVGKFIKDYYLDELPQIYCIFMGDMSFVGPRPLSEVHYLRDISLGNVARKLLKAGIVGEGHVLKGTMYFCSADLEYGYVRKYMTLSGIALLWTDIKIIFRGIKTMLEGKGL